jgi:hypothetical protein
LKVMRVSMAVGSNFNRQIARTRSTILLADKHVDNFMVYFSVLKFRTSVPSTNKL